MTAFTIKDFLTICKEIVMYQHSDTDCDRLNAFILIDRLFDFANDYPKAKENIPYYFSRDNNAIKFPALAIEIDSRLIDDYGRTKYDEYCTSINIGVVDIKIDNCTNCTPCEKRSLDLIGIDASNLLRKFANSISQIKLFKVTVSGDDSYVYSIKSIIELKINEGIYDTYKEIIAESSKYNQTWKERNPQREFTETKVNNLVNVFTNFIVCEICPENETQFTYKKYKPI